METKGEPIVAVTAIPDTNKGPPIPQGHTRYYCEQCQAVCIVSSVVFLVTSKQFRVY